MLTNIFQLGLNHQLVFTVKQMIWLHTCNMIDNSEIAIGVVLYSIHIARKKCNCIQKIVLGPSDSLGVWKL